MGQQRSGRSCLPPRSLYKLVYVFHQRNYVDLRKVSFEKLALSLRLTDVRCNLQKAISTLIAALTFYLSIVPNFV